MAGYWSRRIVIAVLLLGWLGVMMTSVLAGWETPWWVWAPALVGILLVVRWLLPHRTPRRGDLDLYASDAYSDAYLGRRPATHPYQDPSAASQVGQALPPDPIHLSEGKPR